MPSFRRTELTAPSDIDALYGSCQTAWICRTRKESDMPAKILVVDDEPDLELLIRQKFRKHIRDKEFESVFARNEVDAL